MPRLRPRVILSARDLPKPAASTQGDPTGGAAPTPGEPGQSSALGRIVAYVPAEIIATYQALIGVLMVEGSNDASPLFWPGVGLLVLTPFYLMFVTKGPGEPIAWHQVVIATLAFAVWLFGVGNPALTIIAEPFGGWSPKAGSAGIVVGAILLVVADGIAAHLARAKATR